MQYYGQVLTHTHSQRGRDSQDHSHLSPLSFTQLNGKVHTIPQTEALPGKRSRVKVAVNRLNGRSWRSVALSHDWAVFGFEQKHVMPKMKRKHKERGGVRKEDLKWLWQMKLVSETSVVSCICLKHVHMAVPYPVQHLVLRSATFYVHTYLSISL